ncbi:MAG: hypothetical protein FJ319_00875 [SAR202 cluster bacterium]|nr:hypothetical protein [SAR202 cluster bacterium]
MRRRKDRRAAVLFWREGMGFATLSGGATSLSGDNHLTTTENLRVRDRLCSVFSRTNNEDPGGSANWWKRLLVIEVAEPWVKEIIDSKAFPHAVSATVARASQMGASTRLQAVRKDKEYSVLGHSHVMLFTRADGLAAGYSKLHYLVPTENVSDVVEALLIRPDDLAKFVKYQERNSGSRDLFVCTHGSHDTCCATNGIPIFDALRTNYTRKAGGDLRVWQVSHLGGHRLSPNVLDMPDGRYWSRVEMGFLDSLVLHTGSAAAAGRYYRGWAAMPSPWEQIAEREIMVREGWSWFGRPVASKVTWLSDDKRLAHVRVDFTDAKGANPGAFEAAVAMTGTVPTFTCLGMAPTGTANQYAVSRVTKIG